MLFNCIIAYGDHAAGCSTAYIPMGLFVVLQVGVRPGDGDHAMLSSKPLMGYRCMACDRPLGSLEQSPGPYLPTGLMPHSLNTDAVLGAGRVRGDCIEVQCSAVHGTSA